jgi:hypothetical protein
MVPLTKKDIKDVPKDIVYLAKFFIRAVIVT